MLEIVKVLNNSTVIAQDGAREVVVMGKGISFGKRPGDSISKESVEKYFWLDSEANATKLSKLLSEIPILYFELVRDLVDAAKTDLGVTLNDSIYLSLTDHIYFALRRFEQGMLTPNAMLFEIASMYQAEYQFALRSLTYIEQQTGYRLSNDEAGFIALHLIIAQSQNEPSDRVAQLTMTIYELVNLIQEYYQLTLPEDDLYYARFVVHLKFFILRVFRNEQMSDEDIDLYRSMTNQYNRSKEILPIISEYLVEKYGHSLTDGEAFYLTLHLHRLLHRS